jgi:hypothetical protein
MNDDLIDVVERRTRKGGLLQEEDIVGLKFQQPPSQQKPVGPATRARLACTREGRDSDINYPITCPIRAGDPYKPLTSLPFYGTLSVFRTT